MIVEVVVNTETAGKYMNPKQMDGRNLLAMPKAEGWEARIDTGKEVVVESYGEGFVLRTVVVRVADKGCFEMLFNR